MSSESPKRFATNLFAAVVDHPVAVTMFFAAGLVFGWVGLGRLAVELMPDISYPTITVRTELTGAAPQEIESQLSRPLEETLSTLDGLVGIESRSRAGISDVVLQFDWGADVSAASQSIRESLQRAWLPPEAGRPLIMRFDPSLDPFMRVALAPDAESDSWPEGDDGLVALRQVANNDIKRALEALPGVAAVRVQGGLEPEIRVQVKENWLAARKVGINEVKSVLKRQNVNISGGSIIEGDVEYLIRTLNRFTSASDLNDLKIIRNDGTQVPLTDVAVVHEGYVERKMVTHLDGEEAVVIEVFREADANIVEVAKTVKHRLEQVDERLPDGLVTEVLSDQAAFIELAISNVASAASFGGLFAIGVLYLFLRDLRSTTIIGLAIPVSIGLGFAPLYMLNTSLNLMSLGGLALGVGMLVDNAVVVLEAIGRYREEGRGAREAAILGASDVGVAVLASTLTTVAVFLPITFVDGVAGELFGDLSLAVVCSLSASLAVALFGVPMLAARELPKEGAEDSGILASSQLSFSGLKGLFSVQGAKEALSNLAAPAVADWRRASQERSQSRRRWLLLPWVLFRVTLIFGSRVAALVMLWGFNLMALVVKALIWLVSQTIGRFIWMLAGVFQSGYHQVELRYEWLLAGWIRRPFVVLVTAAFTLLIVGFGTRLLGTELMPQLYQGRFTADVALRVGTPLSRTNIVITDLEKRLLRMSGVRTVHSTIGTSGRADAAADEGEHTARIRVVLEEHLTGEAPEAKMMERVREVIATNSNAKVQLSRPSLFHFKTPLEVILYGFDLEVLQQSAATTVKALSSVQGLTDVKSSLVSGNPEIQVLYDRTRLRRLGLTTAEVADQLRTKIQGTEVSDIRRADQRISLLLQLQEPDRRTIKDLASININPNLRPVIPLSAVATLREALGPSEIRRVDQQRAAVVSANLSSFDLGSAAKMVVRTLDQLKLPPEIRVDIGGQSEEMEQSLSSLKFALLLAVFLVYVVMASTFESVVQPLVILVSVPMAAIGVVLALLVSGHSISVVVFIGGIVLAGVVVNNAIVLVDTIHRLRTEQGLPRDEAIERAGKLRLRPILITTSTTVLGLLPLAFGYGAGAEMQGPLAVTIIGGLISSTVLTLGVIPVMVRLVTPPGVVAVVVED